MGYQRMPDDLITHIFQWRRPDNVFPVGAQEFGEFVQAWELEARREMHVGDLLEVAERPTSLCHKIFEWDMMAASHSFRQIQARIILNAIRRARMTDHQVTELQPRRDWIKPQLAESTQRALIPRVANLDVKTTQLKIAYGELRSWVHKWENVPELEEARMIVLEAINLAGNTKKSRKAQLVRRTKKN